MKYMESETKEVERKKITVILADRIYHVDETLSIEQVLEVIRQLNKEIQTAENNIRGLVKLKGLLADITGIHSPVLLPTNSEDYYIRRRNKLIEDYPTPDEQIDALAEVLHQIVYWNDLRDGRKKTKQEIIEMLSLKDLIKE